jgi:hypothetical protein
VVRFERSAIVSSRVASGDVLKLVGVLPIPELERRLEALTVKFEDSPHPHCFWGELCLWLGRYDRALASFDAALERAPARWAYVGRAAVHVLRGDHAAADAEIASCNRHFAPLEGATTHVYLGEACRLRGEHAAAIAHLQTAVQVKPGRAGAWMNLALTHLALGTRDEADRIFDMLQARLPRLVWDAWRTIGGEPCWPIPRRHAGSVFESALAMMRGNRSSHRITYFDADDVFRVLPAFASWRQQLPRQAHFVVSALRRRIALGIERAPEPTRPRRSHAVGDDHPHALSPRAIQRFVEEGHLLLRGCIPRSTVDALVHDTLTAHRPRPRISVRTMAGDAILDPDAVDAGSPETWGATHLNVETGRALPIAELSPRLWGAITSLIGRRHRVRRRTMGEQWIVNGEFATPPRPPLDPSYHGVFGWHIEVPADRTTLKDRHDALVLLVLWSDIAPGAGGPLFSPASLEHVVHDLESHPGGSDTRSQDWGRAIAVGCDDVRELSGAAGDVLVTHPFMLHTAQPNYSSAIRILENPTIFVEEPLDYGVDNPTPSPVERAVISRRRR